MEVFDKLMSIKNKHIIEFDVKNFKKFDHLVVENIGQVNLITGDNNVGKTCLLEALMIDEDKDKSIENLHHSLCKRLVHIHPTYIESKKPIFPSQNYFEKLKNNVKEECISFCWKTKDATFNYKFKDELLQNLDEKDFEKELIHNFNIGRPKLWIKIYIDDVFTELQFMYLDDFKTKFDHGYQPFIYKDASFKTDINRYYAEEIGLAETEILSMGPSSFYALKTNIKSLSFDDKQLFLSYLKIFFDDIEDIAIKKYSDRGDDILSLKLKRYDDYVPITYFGDGTNECVRYILEIQKNTNKQLMIDEIGNGIHHSKMQEFWKILLKVAEKANVQIFATTHSLDCVKAFVAAGETSPLKDKLRLIELEAAKIDKGRQVYASTYNFEQVEAGLLSDINMRGGDIWAEV